MATSEVQIVNLALSRLGEDPIASLTDDTEAARQANRIYELERDALLREYIWNFSVKRATLGLLGSSPEYGWTYEYQLPNDCLRPLALNDDEESGDAGDVWKKEGTKLLTNVGTAKIRYISKVTDVTQFDAMFVDVFAQKLAAEMCDALTGSTTRAAEHMKKYEQKLRTAVVTDAQEGTPDVIEDLSLISVRY